MELMIEDLMQELVEKGGSDLHIASGQPPYGRFSGKLRPMRDEALLEESCNRLIFSISRSPAPGYLGDISSGYHCNSPHSAFLLPAAHNIYSVFNMSSRESLCV